MSGADDHRPSKLQSSRVPRHRVLLPSENKAQVDAYMESADRKLERALKLSRNSPKASHLPDQTEARIMMRRKGYRHGAGAENP